MSFDSFSFSHLHFSFSCMVETIVGGLASFSLESSVLFFSSMPTLCNFLCLSSPTLSGVVGSFVEFLGNLSLSLTHILPWLGLLWLRLQHDVETKAGRAESDWR